MKVRWCCSDQKGEMNVDELSTYISESLSTSSSPRSIKDAVRVMPKRKIDDGIKTGDVSKLSWDSL